MGRTIGIRHQVKRTTQNEPKPTQVSIVDGGNVLTFDIPDEQGELDFLRGVFPMKYRKVQPLEDLTKERQWQIRWRKLPKGGENKLPEGVLAELGHVVYDKEEKVWLVADEVPAVYEGFRVDDRVAMSLGGSGNRLAYALSYQAERLGGETAVYRVPPFQLKDTRGTAEKDEDSLLLARLLESSPALFWVVGPKERPIIALQETWKLLVDTMKDRIKCGQRVLARVHGNIFIREGEYPEGAIEDQHKQLQANDGVFQSLLREEKERERELDKLIEKIQVFTEVFSKVKGCGTRIAVRLIAPVGNIQKFGSRDQLRQYCGVLVREGQFPRHRKGERGKWSTECRQALFLIAEQFNRRPDTFWGQVLLMWKLIMKERHPEIVEVADEKKPGKVKKLYTPGHILKMARWRTATRFLDWLFRAWWDLENGKPPRDPKIPDHLLPYFERAGRERDEKKRKKDQGNEAEAPSPEVLAEMDAEVPEIQVQ